MILDFGHYGRCDVGSKTSGNVNRQANTADLNTKSLDDKHTEAREKNKRLVKQETARSTQVPARSRGIPAIAYQRSGVRFQLTFIRGWEGCHAMLSRTSGVILI
jgi:hypothetical protein